MTPGELAGKLRVLGDQLDDVIDFSVLVQAQDDVPEKWRARLNAVYRALSDAQQDCRDLADDVKDSGGE
jgi:hypothetical protein